MRLWNHFFNTCPLLLDSSSGVAQKIIKENKQKSRSIFLHVAVINSEMGQFSVTYSATERQDAITIETWLKKFIQSGAEYPKQVVSDFFIMYLKRGTLFFRLCFISIYFVVLDL